MIINKKWYFLPIVGLIVLFGCKTIQKNDRKTNTPKKNQPIVPEQKVIPITIWVHGTKLVGSKLLPNFFHCKQGLHPAGELDKNYHHRIIANTLAETDHKRFPFETFYLFGWSGKLSFDARKQAAQELYDSLKQLIHCHEKQYGQKPWIRIITHSHGGNVVLNLPSIKDTNNDIVVISELILLACPIQDYTKHNVSDPIFDTIISLYSTLDALQVLDPQGIYSKELHEIDEQYEKHLKTPLFSQRVLEPHEKIIQAKLKIQGRGIFHVEFLLKRFLRLLPKILDSLNDYKKEKKDVNSKSLLLDITQNKPIKIKEI
jgi:hypothetical protein